MSRIRSLVAGVRRFLAEHPRLTRFIRYSAASVVATGVSFVTLAIAVSGLGAGAVPSAIAAFCTGALVAFAINRYWSWGTARSHGAGRDFIRYWVVALLTAAIATTCTHLAAVYAGHAGLTGIAQLVVIEGAYFGSYAVTFVAKFVLLDRFVFTSRDLRSRAQVENTTRA
jgi:putative flippase GtrA